MNILEVLYLVCFLAPAVLMAGLAGLTRLSGMSTTALWRVLQIVSYGAIAFAGVSLAAGTSGAQ